MRSRYNPDGSVDYEADREIEMLRLADQELERLRREQIESGETLESSACSAKPKTKPTKEPGKKAASPFATTNLFPLPESLFPPTGIPEFLKPKTKS